MIELEQAKGIASNWLRSYPRAAIDIRLSGEYCETQRSWIFGVCADDGQPIIDAMLIVVAKADGRAFDCEQAYLEFGQPRGIWDRVMRWLSRIRHGY